MLFLILIVILAAASFLFRKALLEKGFKGKIPCPLNKCGLSQKFCKINEVKGVINKNKVVVAGVM